MHWLDLIRRAAELQAPSVLLMVVSVKGSTPREPGAAMLVTAEQSFGSIGGGRMEFLAIDSARECLASKPAGWQTLLHYDLVPEREQPQAGNEQRIGQCCGGVVQVHLELLGPPTPEWAELAHLQNTDTEPQLLLSFPAAFDRSFEGRPRLEQLRLGRNQLSDERSLPEMLRPLRESLLQLLKDPQAGPLIFPLTADASASDARGMLLVRPLPANNFVLLLFGAGHVARALVQVLAPLASQIRWHDSRPEEFPSELPARTSTYSEDPKGLIAQAPAGAYFLVMTHSHPQDLALCEAILQRGRVNYLGLIGSRAKRKRFEQELRKRGIADQQLSQLVSPIGVPGIRDKQPAAIAISVAAQLLQRREQFN